MKKVSTVQNTVQNSIFWLAVTLIPASHVQATMSPELNRGEKLVSIAVPNGKRPEVCVIPAHFPGGKYSAKDLQTEQGLCALNQFTNTAICPKTNSTNPGLIFHLLPDGKSISEVQQSNCKGSKGEAKYKLSTSCSYTPSIVGYYHVSRILGGIANVPPSVLRTFDLENHLAYGRRALSLVRRGDIIDQTWRGLISQLSAGAAGKKKDQLLTDDLDQSYGALIQSPKKEAFYKEFFNGGAQNTIRAANFRDRNASFALVRNPAPASRLVGRQFVADNVQKIVQMKDASDLVILDTLLSQQDRFGNIHYFNRYAFFDKTDLTKSGLPSLKFKKDVTPDEAKNAVLVKQMLLKDNDCGVAKDNIAKGAGLAKVMSHVDPKVYKRLLKLAKVIDNAEVKVFFTRNLMFTATDFTGFRKNLLELAGLLKSKCTSGSLNLDLDIEDHFSGQPLKSQNCEIVGAEG